MAQEDRPRCFPVGRRIQYLPLAFPCPLEREICSLTQETLAVLSSRANQVAGTTINSIQENLVLSPRTGPLRANAYFYGCRSSNFAKDFAQATGVTSHGYVQPVGFSSNPKSYSGVWSLAWDGYSGPLYMIPKYGPPMQTYSH